jgi:hypothetical protein
MQAIKTGIVSQKDLQDLEFSGTLRAGSAGHESEPAEAGVLPARLSG